jgi:DNA topoisomerase-1
MAERWITRHGTKKRGFRYVRDDGAAVRDARMLARIEKLRVPPAWRDVHIAPSAVRAIQAWGYDARGRKQYRYNTKAVATRELRKHHRVRLLGKSLPKIRRSLIAESRRPRLTRATTCAIALRLISEGLFRPGNERYERENRSHGMTTLRKRHVRVERGRMVFHFPGKSRKRQRQVMVDAELRALVVRVRRTPGARLFRYRVGGAWRDLSAPMLIDFIRERFGPYAVKDFRTWGGTLRAATVLAELGAPRSATEAKRNVALAMRFVAAELGNTPAICRASYVHPLVTARYVDAGETIPLRARRARRSRIQHSPEERALLAFLDRHFRERRRRPLARLTRPGGS